MTKKAFSLIELSIVILIIGILVAGVTQSSRLIGAFRLSSARNITSASSVNSIKDLALWLEPTSMKSFATGSSGTYVNVEEPENNDSIAKWNDINPQSSYKNDAIQATLANQPSYVRNAINNLPALLFTSSSSESLSSDLNIDYTVNPNMTFFVVFRRLGAAANQCLFGHDNGTWDRFLCNIHSANSGVGGVSNGGGFSTISGLNTANSTMLISLTLQNGVASGSRIAINNGTPTTFTESHNNSGYTTLTIGGISTADFFDGYIAEFIVFTRAIKVEERQSVEEYLSKKWGITLS